MLSRTCLPVVDLRDGPDPAGGHPGSVEGGEHLGGGTVGEQVVDHLLQHLRAATRSILVAISARSGSSLTIGANRCHSES